MSWLLKTAKKAAKKATKRASASAWKTVKTTGRSLMKTEKQELDAWRFWGRSLGSLSRRLKGKPAVSSVVRPTSTKKKAKQPSLSAPKKAGNKAPLRKRAKGERLPADPRFLRTQAKFEAKKNDYLFQVSPRW